MRCISTPAGPDPSSGALLPFTGINLGRAKDTISLASVGGPAP